MGLGLEAEESHRRPRPNQRPPSSGGGGGGTRGGGRRGRDRRRSAPMGAAAALLLALGHGPEDGWGCSGEVAASFDIGMDEGLALTKRWGGGWGAVLLPGIGRLLADGARSSLRSYELAVRRSHFGDPATAGPLIPIDGSGDTNVQNSGEGSGSGNGRTDKDDGESASDNPPERTETSVGANTGATHAEEEEDGRSGVVDSKFRLSMGDVISAARSSAVMAGVAPDPMMAAAAMAAAKIEIGVSDLEGRRGRKATHARPPLSIWMELLASETAQTRSKYSRDGTRREDIEDDIAMHIDSKFRLSMRAFLSAARSSAVMAGVAPDPIMAAAAMAAAKIEIGVSDLERRRGRKATHVRPPLSIWMELLASETAQTRSKYSRDGTRREDIEDDTVTVPNGARAGNGKRSSIDPVDVESSRLLSAAFAFMSNSLGLVADTVRIVGDTTAAATGSSVKIVGSSVKSVGNSLDGAARLIEGNAANGGPLERKRKLLTSETIMSGERGRVKGLLHRPTEDVEDDVMRGTRRVLGKSVRLLASVGRGVGDSILLAGSATESLTSSTAGIAEDAVRLFENLAASLSSTFQVSHGGVSNVEEKVAPGVGNLSRSSQILDKVGNMSRPSTITFGRHEDRGNNNAVFSNTVRTEVREEKGYFIENIRRLCEQVIVESTAFVEFAMADIEGVESLVPEILATLLLCYIISTMFLPAEKDNDFKFEQRQVTKKKLDTTQKVMPLSEIELSIQLDKKIQHLHRESHCKGAGILMSSGGIGHESTLDSESLTVVSIDPWNHQHMVELQSTSPSSLRPLLKKERLRTFRKILFRPWKCLIIVFQFWLKLLFDRRLLLLSVYGIAAFYLCRASQLRSMSIERNAEATGFRAAIASAGVSNSSLSESAVWVNALFEDVWRVHRDQSSPRTSKTECYPDFVLKAMRDGLQNDVYRKEMGESSPLCSDLEPYGGLEPYISSILGDAVMEALATSSKSRPNDVTNISLNSFTLGSKPPIARGVKLKGFDSKANRLRLDVDLDVLLGDASIVLGKWQKFTFSTLIC